MLSMTNSGDPDHMHMFLVTMLMPFQGCRLCRSTVAQPGMVRCGQCWKTLSFPVTYCSRQCRLSDAKRHERDECCGE